MRTLDQIFGTYVPGSDDKRARSKKLTDRPGSEILFVLHHSVSRTIGAIQDTFMSTSREVCATGGCGPLVAGQDKYVMRSYARWNTERPYTTASNVDDRAITVEFADLQLAYPWPVGKTAKYIAAEIVAAMHVELGMPIDTAHVLDHLQVYQRGLGSYPTQCSGDDLRGSIVSYIIPTAKQIVAAAAAGGGTKVTTYYYQDRRKKTLKPGSSDFQRNKANTADQNVIGGVGPYTINCPVSATGAPGDILEILLMRQDQKLAAGAKGRDSDWYTHRMVIPPTGELHESAVFNLPKTRVEGGRIAFFSKVRTPKTNKQDVVVTVQDSIAYLFTGA